MSHVAPVDESQTVLYVEDHPVNVVLMQALFDKRPALSLCVATSGDEALRMASGLRPRLLLLDLRLPDCHGSELLRALRLLPGFAEPPAVAVTAESDFNPHPAGFQEVWAKPLDLQAVLARLDNLTATAPPADASLLCTTPHRIRPLYNGLTR